MSQDDEPIQVSEPFYAIDQYRWIRNQVALSLLSLDDEVQKIPVLLQMAGEMAVEAGELRDVAKSLLDRAKAQAAQEIREEAATSNAGKAPSETLVESKIALNQGYQTALSSFQTARRDAGLWDNIYRSLQQKGYSINVASELIKSGFISTDYITEQRRKEIRNAKA